LFANVIITTNIQYYFWTETAKISEIKYYLEAKFKYETYE